MDNEDIEIRTMESDINAIKASGGDLSSIQLSGILKEKKKTVEQPEDVKIKLGVPGYAGPEQAIFAAKGEVVGEKNAAPVLKMFFLVLGIIIAAAAVGFLAYYIALKFIK